MNPCADCGTEKKPLDPKGDYCRSCYEEHLMWSDPILRDAYKRGFLLESELRAGGCVDLGLAAEEMGKR